VNVALSLRPHPVVPALLRRSLALVALSLAALVPAAAAQIDFSVPLIQVNQSIQTGTTPLTAGRATFVRAVIRVINGPPGPVAVDGLMRVYVGGVETPDSPVFSDNGPFLAGTPSFTTENGTLNFITLAPQGNNVTFTIEVNPAGPNFVPELNTANNVSSTPNLVFAARNVPEFMYSPIDYRPSGGTVPNLPSVALIEPGVGDSFVQGIYPAKDFYYHRTDAPSKLWTSSLASTGSSLLTALQADIALMSPQPDNLYAWVPGPLPAYNGQSIIGQPVSMGNTDPLRHQRTYAHEVGHNTGLSHNTITTNVIGVDVEHHLNLTQGLPQIKDASLKDIMYAGLLTQEAWVYSTNYNHFYNHPILQPGADALTYAGPMIFVAGQWNTSTGGITVEHSFAVQGGRPTAAAEAGAADLLVRVLSGGQELARLPLSARSSLDECPVCNEHGAEGADADAAEPVAGLADGSEPGNLDAPGVSAVVPFAFTLPVNGSFDRLVIEQAGARLASTLQLQRTPGLPQAAFVAPLDGRLQAGPVRVAWTASDPDGDVLSFYLRYSPDGGTRWVPLATGLSASEYVVDLGTLPELKQGLGVFELRASDGLNTTVVQSAPLSGPVIYAAGVGNPPWVEVVTPDPGYSFQQGATVVLHSSGWDLEDRGLDGASLQWSSDVDGPLGEGRLLTVNTLSAGEHVITVTATDSSLLQASDSANITITPRDLPDTGELVCQDDLGFGGPGSSVLSLCGQALATGNTADLLLTGAPASTTVFLFVGVVNDPTPIEGGVLVPVPFLAMQVFATDSNGELSLPGVPGGGGPLTGYAQAIVVDGAQTLGYGFSNAIELDLLP